jgi:hypothetical protein
MALLQNASSDATADAQMAIKPEAMVSVVKVSVFILVSPVAPWAIR